MRWVHRGREINWREREREKEKEGKRERGEREREKGEGRRKRERERLDESSLSDPFDSLTIFPFNESLCL